MWGTLAVVLYGISLESTAMRILQLLLAGANSGQLSHKDVYVFQKSYAACLDYPTVEVPSAVEHCCVHALGCCSQAQCPPPCGEHIQPGMRYHCNVLNL